MAQLITTLCQLLTEVKPFIALKATITLITSADKILNGMIIQIAEEY
jgi:hypothetical protein